jgi:hypothetical protein
VRRESEEEESLWSEWIGDVVTGTEYDVEVMDSTKGIKNNDSNGTECKHVVDFAKETKEVEYKTLRGKGMEYGDPKRRSSALHKS